MARMHNDLGPETPMSVISGGDMWQTCRVDLNPRPTRLDTCLDTGLCTRLHTGLCTRLHTGLYTCLHTDLETCLRLCTHVGTYVSTPRG